MSLIRFLEAQEKDYEIALEEIKNGKKESHWIWYVFPQLRGLGNSYMSEIYGIESIVEARDFTFDEILGPRLIEITSELLKLSTNNIADVMPYPDDLKLRSSMTLFAEARPDLDIFQKVLDKFYEGKRDNLTIEKLYGFDV